MWKRIILTGFLILKMGQINMNDLQADTSDIIKEILMCVVIAMTGMFGITGVYRKCFICRFGRSVYI